VIGGNYEVEQMKKIVNPTKLLQKAHTSLMFSVLSTRVLAGE